LADLLTIKMIKQPTVSKLEGNARTLRAEMTWLKEVLDTRIKLYFGHPSQYASIYEVPVPNLEELPSIYADFVKHYQMSVEERLILLLSLSPHVAPQLLDVFFIKNEQNGQIFSEFGGLVGKVHRGFLPTGETASFMLAGNDLTRRFQVTQIFDPDYYLLKQKIILLDKDNNNEPFFAAPLGIGKEFLSLLTTGVAYKPNFSSDFPAERIETRLEWEDLVLDPSVYDEIHDIISWIRNAHTILNEWGLKKQLKRGYRALFYGPPGTGKTLTASLLGKSTGLDVYRIDISKMVSKYIGETEKNLANIFDLAENKNWILFFDEADALFGKRSSTSDAKDRYANQEVAYLLQRVEDFPGVVVLSTNLKSNIDVAFIRRFQTLVYFPVPAQEQRLIIWERAFRSVPKAENVDFRQIARDFEIPGGVIINVLRYCALQALNREGDEARVFKEDVVEGIRKELRKEGKTV